MLSRVHTSHTPGLQTKLIFLTISSPVLLIKKKKRKKEQQTENEMLNSNKQEILHGRSIRTWSIGRRKAFFSFHCTTDNKKKWPKEKSKESEKWEKMERAFHFRLAIFYFSDEKSTRSFRVRTPAVAKTRLLPPLINSQELLL